MTRIRLTERQYRHAVSKGVISEVRYIDTDASRKKDWQDVYRQEPIDSNEKIRVFHGCELDDALNFARYGFTGGRRVPRRYSYEAGMNPHGLFVTTDLSIALKFCDRRNCAVMEFTANSDDLDTPVWNGNSSYFGQGSNPQPFGSKAARDVQKRNYQDDASKSEYAHVRNSANPALADRIFNDTEHQALFFGNLNANMIKRFWVKGSDGRYERLSRDEFVRKYSKYEISRGNGTAYDNEVEAKNKCYGPNDDFKSVEDAAMGYLRSWYGMKDPRKSPQFKQDYEMVVDSLREYIDNANSGRDWYVSGLCTLFYPKQLIQLFGQKWYDENVGEVWR